jgi:pyrroloquinoline-quinone synthase
MSSTVEAPRVTQCADEVIRDSGILQNAYFKKLQSGELNLDCFRRTQEQFFFAVTFFPRPMSALVGRIPDPRLRLDILHNVVEEHGEFDEEQFHHTTFQKFLSTIGSDATKLDGQTLWPALRAFNSVLTASCVLDELEVGVSCMGIIEYCFADISALIGRAVVDRNWVKADELVHYKLHAEIDKRHAQEFFAVVEPHWPTRRYYIEQGLQLGVYIFDRLYSDMLRTAERDLKPPTLEGDYFRE